MTYMGNGVWKLDDHQVQWGGNVDFAKRKDNYRFSFLFKDTKTQQYGMLNTSITSDNPVLGTTSAEYWGVYLNDGGNTVEKGAYRWPASLIDASVNPKYSADITLYMNYSQADYYVHTFTDIKEL